MASATVVYPMNLILLYSKPNYKHLLQSSQKFKTLLSIFHLHPLFLMGELPYFRREFYLLGILFVRSKMNLQSLIFFPFSIHIE